MHIGNLPSAHSALGAAYIHKEMWAEAIAACESALSLKSDYANALSNVSYAYFKNGQMKEAGNAAQGALKLNPADRLASGVLEQLKKA